ncbi:MAG: tRNA (guanosine(37)-N1)-methyltransferase TrmD [Gemmatimonadetes bacterium]|nr:tRNA (guanosine(37)-N1)-methyltransferase TrmD [Gemmatimonadota bacterium]MYD27125.1 tRNA (guanosine(37)-N1)-methyltransferase TrmD [Gemmatimonadota bacterium]MYI99104.1 tRNA (guanosine(37)-N1)-methyltransferase TrmD [Gemmatimonadota bacterium]
MRIDILTAFPGVFAGPFGESIVGRACRRDLVDVFVHDLRAFTTDRHKTVDDYAYGGSPGMVLKAEPIFRGVRHLRRQVDASSRASRTDQVDASSRADRSRTVLLSAGGKSFVQDTARSFAELDQLVLICGHYKGVDERVAKGLGAEEYSVGDFVVTGGEIPAMMIADAVIRLLPGVLGEMASAVTDSHYEGLLGNAVYTRPENYQEWRVPEVLLSGHHGRIERWERQDALKKTYQHRPELLETVELTGEDLTYLRTLQQNENG